MVYVITPPPESTTGYPVTGISSESNSHHTNYLVSEYKEFVFLVISYHIADFCVQCNDNLCICILIICIHYDHECKFTMIIKQLSQVVICDATIIYKCIVLSKKTFSKTKLRLLLPKIYVFFYSRHTLYKGYVTSTEEEIRLSGPGFD